MRRRQYSTTNNNQYLTADEAAEVLRMTRRALYAAVARGEIPAHRLGRRRLRFLLSELEGLLVRRCG